MGFEIAAAVIIGGAGIAATREHTTGAFESFENGLIASQRLFDQQLAMQQTQLEQSFLQFKQFSPEVARIAGENIQASSRIDPVFAALQDSILADLQNGGQNAALNEAFEAQVSSQLASRGVLASPRSALSSSFALLQFREAQRQQSFANAAGLTQLRSPTGNTGFAFQNPQMTPPAHSQQLGISVGASAFQFKRSAEAANNAAVRSFTNSLSGFFLGQAGDAAAAGRAGSTTSNQRNFAAQQSAIRVGAPNVVGSGRGG